MAVTGCALLIVCANVATLMLVRGLERRRQTSLTIALGARRSRVVREPLIESLLLSIAGGVAGLAIAFAGTRVILQVVFPVAPWRRRRAHRRVAVHTGAAVRVRRVARDGARLRHRARVDGHSRRSDGRAARDRPLDGPHRLAAANGPDRVPGGAVARAAVGGRAADGGPVWPGESGVRIRAGRSPGGASQSAAGRIPSGPADAALRSDPRCRVARSWRLRRGALHLLAVRQQLLGHEHLGGWTCRARTE